MFQYIATQSYQGLLSLPKYGKQQSHDLASHSNIASIYASPKLKKPYALSYEPDESGSEENA